MPRNHKLATTEPARSPEGQGAIPKLPAAIDAEALQVRFGIGTKHEVEALGPVDLRVDKGEFVTVVGPSGCGKSTLVKVVAGLVAPTGGHLDVGYEDPSKRAPIATVFQDFGLFPWKTVIQNVSFALRVKGLSRQDARAQASSWIERLGLSGFEDNYPATLSGGMRQRVAIARALAVEPEILLMDEPFASLDAQLRELLQEELLDLSQKHKRTIVFVTHSLEEAIVLGDRVVVMTARPGRIIASVEVPFGRPRTTAVRNTPEFTQLRGELWDQLRAQVERQLAVKEAS